MQIHLTTTEFRTLFEPILPWAGADDMLPVLTAVHLRVKGDYLVVEATDRFRVGLNRLAPQVMLETATGNVAPLEHVKKDGQIEEGWARTLLPPELDVLIPAGQIKRALTLFKAPRNAGFWNLPVLTLMFSPSDDRISGGKVTISSNRELAGGLHDLRLTMELIAGEFPKLGSLFREALTDTVDHGSEVGLNPKLLSAWSTACKVYGEQVVRWRIRGGAKAMLGYVGEDFVGLVMPRRLLGESPEHNDHAKEWAEFLA